MNKLTLFLAILVSFVFTGCGNEKSKESQNKTALKVLSTHAELLGNEGEEVIVKGVYEHSSLGSLMPLRIRLEDSTYAVLHINKNEKLTKGDDQVVIQVTCKVYDKVIPEKYGIISRTISPYLVDITKITNVKE